jgi:hypothetical protein
MKTSHTTTKRLLAVFLTCLVCLLGVVLAVGARSSNTISVTITNHSNREIRHVYVAAGDPNNWGPDQLHGSIPSGGSATVSDVGCDASSVRVIAEDNNGCFVYYNAACDANQTWEITDGTAPDCGGR